MTDPVAEQSHLRHYRERDAVFLATPDRGWATIETNKESSPPATRFRLVGGRE